MDKVTPKTPIEGEGDERKGGREERRGQGERERVTMINDKAVTEHLGHLPASDGHLQHTRGKKNGSLYRMLGEKKC